MPAANAGLDPLLSPGSESESPLPFIYGDPSYAAEDQPLDSPRIASLHHADADPDDQVFAGRWWQQRDLDRFLHFLYQHFDTKGFGNIVAKKLLDHARVLFVLWIVLVLTVVIDYKQLEHHLEHKCPGDHQTDLMQSDCHGNVPIDFGRIQRMPWGVWLAILIFLGIWGWSLATFLFSIPQCLAARDFYEQELGLTSRRLQTITWDTVVKRLIKAQARLQLCTDVESFDELDVTNLITRRRNFHIAFYRELGPRLAIQVPTMGSRVIVSESLQWNIHKVLDTVIFNGRCVDERVFATDVNERAKLASLLRFYFQCLGVLNLLLAPGVLLFRLTYFIFHNSNSLRKSAGPLATRQWSPYACYLLRNYSEVDHLFRQRISRTHTPANKYVELFVSESTSIWARFFVFIVGGLFVVLTLLGFIFDEDFLFAYLTPDRSVIWWTGILGIALAAAQSLIVGEECRDTFADTLKEVIEITAYKQDKWLNEEDSLDTYDSFTALFQLKGVTFMEELMSILLITPYILLFKLPHECDMIVGFFRNCTYRHPNLGHFCKFARFYPGDVPLDHFSSNIDAGGDNLTVETQYAGGAYDSSKLDHSIRMFKQEHPSWRPNDREDMTYMSESVSLPSLSENLGDSAYAGPVESRNGVVHVNLLPQDLP